jgi:hypothetical protein
LLPFFFLLISSQKGIAKDTFKLVSPKSDTGSQHPIRVLMFSGFASPVLPMGNLANDYGMFGEVGLGIQYMTKSKLIFGIEGAYLFGNGVKKDPVPYLRSGDGTVTGTDGSDAVFKVFQRGVNFPSLRAGKVWGLPYLKKRRNEGGFSFQLSTGWFRHWTYIQDQSKKTPQFSEEYKKGYDRLASGPTLGGWLGFLSLPDGGKLNFQAELGYTHAFTKTNRFDFSTQEAAGKKRSDGLLQIRFRICFSVKSRAENTVYYY